MSELFKRITEPITNWVKGLDNNKKMMYGAAGVVFLVVLISLLFIATRTNYVVLSRGVSVQNAAEITAKLDELGIIWKTEDNSTTVLVDETQVDKARMGLTMSGVTTGDGFTYDDVWDKLTFTQTTQEKNRMFLIAQQTSIANALKTLDGIEDAIVMLSVKETSSFLNIEDDVSTASIQVRTKAGLVLQESQVQGIVNYVATAVKGLAKENITIIDQTGAQLNNTDQDTEWSHSNSQADLKAQVEAKLDKNLSDFLAQVYGKSNVKVKSSVKLDFDSEETSIIQFTTPVEGASDGLIRSMSSLKENVVPSSDGGVAGTETNTTDTPTFPTSDSGSSAYTKSQETLNYELNEVQQRIEKAKGQIKTISIAVILNKSSLVDQELTDEHKQQVIQVVSAAAGFDDTKYVEVLAADFVEETLVPLPSGALTLFNIPLWVFGVILVFFILSGVVTMVLIKRRANSLKAAQEIIEEQEELEEISLDFQDRSSPKYQIEKFIDSKPDAVANLLRSWLNDD